ncbi:MAG: hypothetical protein JEY91_11470 [Spirochaetaceae bacterium]|nr:hypothetical protein [Spirochaetaceae bacterium]
MEKTSDCLAVGLSPAIQRTLIFNEFREGEVNRSERYYTDASGKCINVCRVLTQGGMDAFCLTIAGRENREEFESLCRGDSLEFSTVETSGRVRICTTIVDLKTQNCTELVVNEPEAVNSREEQAFSRAFEERLKKGYRAVIISGSKFEGFSHKIIPYMVKKAKEQPCLVLADYRGEDLKNSFISDTIRPDIIKINKEEFFQTFPAYEDLESGIIEVSSQFNCAFIISRGSESTIGADKGKIFHVDSKIIQAVNPIGCGDAMTAGITQGLLEGLPLKEAVEKGRDYATRNALSIHPGWIRAEK